MSSVPAIKKLRCISLDQELYGVKQEIQCPLLETINSQLLISSRDEGLQKRICKIKICLSVSVKENGYPSQRFLLLKRDLEDKENTNSAP